MRDQYVGDISDLIKYALLRALALDRGPLGIAWYYNRNDSRKDGRHREYREDEKWCLLDARLLSALRGLSDAASVLDVERLPIWPDETRFHHELVPGKRLREAWAVGMGGSLATCNLVFLDPDNGIADAGRRHATWEEVKSLRRPGKRTIVLIKFPSFTEWHHQRELFHLNLHMKTGAEKILTLWTSVQVPIGNGHWAPRSRWFTLLDYQDAELTRLECFAQKLKSIAGVKATLPRG